MTYWDLVIQGWDQAQQDLVLDAAKRFNRDLEEEQVPYRAGSPNTGVTHKVEVEERTYGVTLRWRADEEKRRMVLEGVFIVRADGEDLLGSDLRKVGWRALVARDRQILQLGVEGSLTLDRDHLAEYGLDLSGVDYVAEVMQDGRRKYPEDHYRLVGEIYQRLKEKGTRDVIQATCRELERIHRTDEIPWLPKTTKFPKTTVRNWIAIARKKGFIDDGASS